MNLKKITFFLSIIISFYSCRDEYDTRPEEEITIIPIPEDSIYNGIKGLYILNEGNMGSNKATLDYYSYEYGTFRKNIYGTVNPSILRELGDAGNDIKIYGSKMYAVINASNYIEVMDAKTAKHIGEIKIPNCRYITFDKEFAYVTSFAGSIGIDPNTQKGYVAKIDTASLSILESEIVGYQPEEIAVANNKLYVANSGGYTVTNYDRTVSVIDLNTFKEIKKIDVEINLWKLKVDKNDNIWVASRGDYSKIPPKIFVINSKTDKIIEEINEPVSDFYIVNDKLYYYGYNLTTSVINSNYGIIDINTKTKISGNFIKNGIESEIIAPYGIIVNPENGEIFITDAKNYISSGEIFCFNKNGELKWKNKTGDIPGHLTFLY